MGDFDTICKKEYSQTKEFFMFYLLRFSVRVFLLVASQLVLVKFWSRN